MLWCIWSERPPEINLKSIRLWKLFWPFTVQVVAWYDHKIVLFWSAEQFYDHIMQKLVKTGKNTEINKQSNVKFWLNWIRYGAVSYSSSCTLNHLWVNRLLCIIKNRKYLHVYKIKSIDICELKIVETRKS